MDNDQPFPLLSRIDSPADLRTLTVPELAALAQELRAFLIQSVSETGGHLAAGLGVVELTVALHYVFNTPDDRLVWDVGHQAYPHKILTGRREQMHTLRSRGGLAGFLRREESEYDTFGAGHSSTSISAALGMAVAAMARGELRQSVAVIGDGALTAGMAFEALNHARDVDVDLLVVLNDNKMSISPNVGAIHKNLARVLSSRLYTTMRRGGKSMLGGMPTVQELARRWEEHLKGMVLPGTLFEEVGFNYIGPIDGHDLPCLVKTLKNMRAMRGRRLLHVLTRKGQGYTPAEGNPCAYHGVAPFDSRTGDPSRKKATGRTWSQVFGEWICDAAQREPKLCAITPAMGEGSGLVGFAKRFRDRYFDVGIAEQHALTFAAGLSCEDMKPVVAIYSTFLQRGYDQLIHDIALQNLDVTLAVDRAGLVGEDGSTHAGSFDLSFLRCIPNLVIMAPGDEDECYRMLNTALAHKGPAVVRYPRGAGPGVAVNRNADTLEIGRGEIVQSGSRVAVLAFGHVLQAALDAGRDLDATVVNMRFVKPLDEALITELADSHDCLVTVEENAVAGGAGSAVHECLQRHGRVVQLMHLGLPDSFAPHGSVAQVRSEMGLDSAGIRQAVLDALRAGSQGRAEFIRPAASVE